ncbi:chemotaxis protein CheB [Fervidobacterium nodosum]|uniref:protein-glutamate methylesterase n=1 Tax=Fervidobacterium nodosum (strain ATCC 35602 / DSM 5306 / Rt17-B1) TaxID=381764 RepID=A7HLI1_FERNB|nr:chemotaxis protein CheB [Fervidobacterium nodosum]ABS60764.1 hypothetical protein Fnod_0914 [Fervidobacterium nodosum Rt17-B1]HOJ93608.1 chemotaxis protein CheB [Fervidobacterium nodosum]
MESSKDMINKANYKVIIVGSAGSPNVAVNLLKINEKLNIPVIICIHFTSSAMETFANHIEIETGHIVKIVDQPTPIKNEIYLPKGGKDIIFISENTLNSVESEYKVHPSISKLFESLVKYADDKTTIIVLGGLGDDGKDYAKILRNKGVKFVIEKSPRFPYLPNNIAKELEMRYEQAEQSRIKDIIIRINRQALQDY